MSLRSPTLLTLILGLVFAPPAHADGPRPGDWTVIGEPTTFSRGAWQPGLWLPMREGQDPVLVGDALGRHAAMYPVSSPRCVVTLSRLVKGDLSDAPAIRYLDATLEPADGASLRPTEGEAWRGQPAGQRSIGDKETGMTEVTIPFPPLDPSVCALTLRVPVVDGVTIVVRFARWHELVAAAEVELAAWKQHVEARRMVSAISPYLDCDAYRALRARDDALVAALLLRELARGEERHDASALPRFLVLHVLAGTEWGHAQQVPAWGDDAVARRVLHRWRDLGSPQVPGISPHEGR